MWKDFEQAEMKNIFPSTSEFRQALKPPTKPQEKTAEQSEEKRSYILWVQIGICCALLAAVFIVRRVEPAIYETCREVYKTQLEQGVELSGQEELIKFANAALEGVRVQAGQMMQELEEKTNASEIASVGLAAGIWPLKTQRAPEGCSLDAYLPEQPLSQPITGYIVTSDYGWRTDPITKEKDFHKGIDLATAQGTEITPALPGIVQKAAYNSSYGNYVLIIHANGVATRYAHMQYVFVKQGQKVTQQDILGTVGQTGAATGPHLHFELMHEDVRYDPKEALGIAQ